MRLILIIIGLAIFSSCQSGINDQEKQQNSSLGSADNQQQNEKLQDDSRVAKDKSKDENSQGDKSAQTVVDFLKWYKKNYAEITKIQFVNNMNFGDGDSTKPYSVNYKDTENYLGKLKSSGYISDKYMQKWRKYFKEQDQNFKNNTQYCGPPMGFEFDFVLWTQMIGETLEAIDNYKLMEVNESDKNANVKIRIGMYLNFILSKDGDDWMIDNIENLGEE